MLSSRTKKRNSGIHQEGAIRWKQLFLLLWVAPLFVDLVAALTASFPASLASRTYRHDLSSRNRLRRSSAITHLALKVSAENAEATVDLKSLLNQYDFDTRLTRIQAKDLPVLAEVHLKGQSELCHITALRSSIDPTVEVQLLSSQDKMVADLGQITTLWNDDDNDDNYLSDSEDLPELIANEMNKFPVGFIEQAMDSMYRSHVGRARSSDQNSLTKKQVTKLVANIPSESEQSHAENVLRKLIKSGKGCSRIVDSYTARDYLYPNAKNLKKTCSSSLQQAVAAHILSNDASTNGRFKRMLCTFIEQNYQGDNLESISVINGGWLVVDQAVRAGTDAKKFSERIENNKENDKQQPWTVSDERIAQRMECLAMGEVLSQGEEEYGLELDVREALKNLGAPVTPEGAREVLVRIGRWSQESDPRFGAQPWSVDVLNAAKWYAEHVEKLKVDWGKSDKQRESLLEGRTDLTSIPFICVDAKRTTFRDDAIGLRPRDGTGRKVSSASKWEILVSTVDVSDIYTDNPDLDKTSSDQLKLLGEAAASRGVSRYDLPLGPLHLMPPIALHALAFDAVPIANAGQPKSETGFNRCVTLWVYIDETSGKLLDAGIERSIISRPTTFSYEAASALLDGKVDTSHDPTLKKSQLILSVLERNFQLWSQQRRQTSNAAQKREERLALREFVGKQQLNGSSNHRWRDDGSNGFQRTRGHRLVDTALDLYSYAISNLLKRAKAPIPYQAGTSAERGARLATAPLRRYVDGMAQRQALSVLCGYGGPPLTKEECKQIGQEATEAYNAISNIRSVKKSVPGMAKNGPSNQKTALKKLELHLKARRSNIVPAVSTGKTNEVVISGVGVIAKCKGIKGTLKPGKQIMVKVLKIDADKGSLSVTLAVND